MILIRFLLISLIAYLLVRSFMNYSREDGQRQETRDSQKNKRDDSKKISKSIGEYVDYEEVKKQE